MIIHAIKCPKCSCIIWSKYTHDFKTCSCGYCSIDGGREYTRVLFGSGYGLPSNVDIDVNEDGTFNIVKEYKDHENVDY